MYGRRTKYFCQIAVEGFCYRLLKSEQRSEIKTSHLLSMFGFWPETESRSKSGHPIGYTQWRRNRTVYVPAPSRPSGASQGMYWSSVVIFIMTSVRRHVCVTYSRVVLEALSTHLGFFCRIDTTSNIIICTTEAGGVLRISVNSPGLGNIDRAWTGESICSEWRFD